MIEETEKGAYRGEAPRNCGAGLALVAETVKVESNLLAIKTLPVESLLPEVDMELGKIPPI